MKVKTLYITYMGLTEPLLHSQALSYLKILSAKGISVYILSFEKKQLIKKENIAEIREDLAKCGIKWFFLTYHKRPQLISKPYDIVIGMFFALRISLKERIDVIHARGTMSALIGILPVIFFGRKMIFDIRGLMAEEYVDAGLWERKFFTYKIVDKLEKYFIKNSDKIIVLNNRVRDMVSNKYNRKNITIIPTCVNLEKFNFKKEANYDLVSKYPLGGKFVLMYVGSVGTWYMLSEMVDFYKELMEGGEKAVFFILSQTDRKIIDLYIDKRVREKVIIDSAIPEKVSDFLNLANTAIFFIKPCFSKAASCPTKFGEYLACGLPIVINKGIGDTADIVKENRVGVVVENFTKEEYRRRIGELKELLKEGEPLKRRCREVAERYFSLEKGAEKYFQVYSGIDK